MKTRTFSFRHALLPFAPLAPALPLMFFAWGAVSCGSQVEGGANPGSETHWLAACSTDAECSVGSCECGICTKACEGDRDCDFELEDDEPACGASSEVRGCAANAPALLCLSARSLGGREAGSEADDTAGDAASGDPVDASVEADCRGPGHYQAGKEGSYRPCCEGLTEVFQLLPAFEGEAETPVCIDPPLRVYACVEGSCGDGICELGEDVACGCVDDCPGAAWGAVEGGAPEPDVTGGAAAPDPAELVLCDGSDDVRFVMLQTGGFVDSFYEFIGAYGHRFMAIDGQCNVWVGNAADGKVRTAQLDAAAAEAAQVALSYGHLEDYADYQAPDCDDSAPTILSDPWGSTRCDCVCDAEDAPSGWRAAIATARSLQADSFVQGVNSTSALRLLIVEDESGLTGGVAWPLSWEPELQLFRFPPDSPSPSLTPDSGFLLDLAPELEALRAAREEFERSATYATNHMPYVMFEHAAEGEPDPARYQIYMLDQVPGKVRRAIEAAEGRAWVERVPYGRACESNSECELGVCAALFDDAGQAEDPVCWECLTDLHAGSGFACDEDADCCQGYSCCEDCADGRGVCAAQ